MNRTDEDQLFEAYAEQIAVPEMWEGVRRRIARRQWFRGVAWLSAAAAALIAVVILFPRERPTAVAVASERYATACRSLEAKLRTTAPLLPELTEAVARAERAARRSPDDPVAVSFFISAYDAKLEYLIGVVHDQS